MNTAMQHQRRTSRQAARARALADRNYWQVGYLDALLQAPSGNPYPLDTLAHRDWQGGYDDGQRERAQRFGAMLNAMREGCDL